MAGQSVGSMILFTDVGGLVGTLLAGILGRLFGGGGFIRTLLTDGVSFGLKPPVTINLRVLTLSFGFAFRITLLGVVGLVLGVYLYRKL